MGDLTKYLFGNLYDRVHFCMLVKSSTLDVFRNNLIPINIYCPSTILYIISNDLHVKMWHVLQLIGIKFVDFESRMQYMFCYYFIPNGVVSRGKGRSCPYIILFYFNTHKSLLLIIVSNYNVIKCTSEFKKYS